jgi:competence ComEA-like helix-hairpin-helix protein
MPVDEKRRELFTRSEIRALLFLAALLLIGGAAGIYQKSRAVVYPDVIITQVQSEARPVVKQTRSPGAITAEMLVRHKININTASADSLELLPGIGPQLAMRIVDFRTRNGRFIKTDDLINVRGIGSAKLEVIRNMITAGGQ